MSELLKSLVCGTALDTASSALSAHAVDGLAPRGVFSADSPEAACRALKAANDERLAVVPWGGGTKMRLGNLPTRVDLVLKLDKMNRLVEHDAANLTATVQAGARLADVQRALAERGQFLPLDPPFAESATIGGILATNSSGPKRLFYGSARDLVLGMKVALPSGEIIKAGGKTVKNVAGYDLCKLFIGSLGTLGVITEATFRLLPIPEAGGTVMATFETLDAAFERIMLLISSQLQPAAVECLNAEATTRLQEIGGLGKLAEGVTCFVRFEGVREAMSRQMSEVGGQWRGAVSGLVTGKADTELWRLLRNRLVASPGAVEVVCKASVPISSTSRMLAAGQGGAMARPGLGIAHFVFAADAPVERLATGITSLRRAATELGGSLVVEAASAELKKLVDVWGGEPQGLTVMRRLKQAFDPGALLNPGRLIVPYG
ncbi:MAG: FAD-binding oxidoreductase [Planctomycetes bacterium]|nr:FAD-binding oxidoreductase [Planctomycetota bacterium]MBM4085305.1 FAD-binding oxidoreductase [Planctomycetota bacterium]